jgi:hypothetical protein
MSETPSTKQFVVATAVALFLGVVLSIGAVYGLNRFFGEQDEVPTGTVGTIHGR